MRKSFFLLLSLLAAGHLLAQKAIINDPKAELRQAKGFHAIEVSNSIDLFLIQSE